MLINGTYLAKKNIGQGSFGSVYMGINTKSKEEVAIKFEKCEKDNSDGSTLLREAETLKDLQNIKGIPKLYYYGTEQNYNIMVMTLLDRDLEHYIKIKKNFQIDKVISIGEQLLNILEGIHKKGYIHRDIKPENILFGRGKESNTVFLIDFGITKPYIDRKTNEIIPYRTNKPFIGTIRYASVAAHKGFELSRRDDLESMGYVLCYLAKGNLPWQNMLLQDDMKKYYVGKIKQKMPIKKLCKGLPEEFALYFEYIQQLEYKQEPKYDYLKSLFAKASKSLTGLFSPDLPSPIDKDGFSSPSFQSPSFSNINHSLDIAKENSKEEKEKRPKIDSLQEEEKD